MISTTISMIIKKINEIFLKMKADNVTDFMFCRLIVRRMEEE